MAWSGTVHGLLGSIAAGVNADYQAGFAHFAAWRTMLVGFAIGVGGLGLLTVSVRSRDRSAEVEEATPRREYATTS